MAVFADPFYQSTDQLSSLLVLNYNIAGYMDWDRPTDADVEIKCNEDNTLAVIWPTDVTYPGDVTKLSDDLEQRLNARFMITGVFTSLFFLKSNPPT